MWILRVEIDEKELKARMGLEMATSGIDRKNIQEVNRQGM
jgi:F420-0:gamma-glutamyl ligase